MRLTVDMLLNFMGDVEYDISQRIKGMQFIHGIKYLTGHMDHFQHGFLYVCDKKNLKKNYKILPEDIIVVGVGRECKMEDEWNSLVCGLVLIQTEYTDMEVLNQLLESYYSLLEWDKDMHIAALEGGSVQKLFDISEKIIRFPMIAYDACFDVIAYTKNSSCTYKNFMKTIKNGYTDSQTMKKLKEKHIFSKIKSDDILIAPAVDGDENINIYTQYFDRQTLLGYANIFCGTARPEQGYLDLIQLFMENMRFCFKREYENKRYGRMMYETFFSNLIRADYPTAEQLKDQLSRIDGIKDTGRYMLGILDFRQRGNVPLAFLARLLEQQFWNIKPFLYEENLCLLKSMDKSYPDPYFLNDKDMVKLDKLLENYDYILGLSNVILDLSHLKDAYLQAKSVLTFGREEEGDRKVFFYRDYCYFHMFSLLGQQMDVTQIQTEFYQDVLLYDKTFGTGYCEMFLCYLKNDCSTTRTAENIEVHRNTIRNMIKFLEKNFNVSASDPYVKAGFVLSDHVQQYVSFVEKKKNTNVQNAQ